MGCNFCLCWKKACIPFFIICEISLALMHVFLNNSSLFLGKRYTPHLWGNDEFLSTTAKDLNIHLQVLIHLLHAQWWSWCFHSHPVWQVFGKYLLQWSSTHRLCCTECDWEGMEESSRWRQPVIYTMFNIKHPVVFDEKDWKHLPTVREELTGVTSELETTKARG